MRKLLNFLFIIFILSCSKDEQQNKTEIDNQIDYLSLQRIGQTLQQKIQYHAQYPINGQIGTVKREVLLSILMNGSVISIIKLSCFF